MFALKKSTLGKSTENYESLIGVSLRIDGNLTITKCIRIDGAVNGNILQEEGAEATVAVADGGCVVGDIRAKHVIISGSIKGNIFSTGRVEVLASATIEGDIRYGSIGLEVGAQINGNLDRIDAVGSQLASMSVIEKAKTASSD